MKEFGAVDYIDFCPVTPYNFAVTSSVRVQIYNPITKLVLKNLSSFQKQAYGGAFRKDGMLLVAGDEDSMVRIFDTNSRTVLRALKGHKAPVHRCLFTNDMLRVASFSDDKFVKIWDVATERTINNFLYHEDYVRAGAVHPISDNIVLSGGYDNQIKMYDIRTSKCVMSVSHNSPVESLVFLPTGGIFLSAGGNEIKAWDVVAGGRQLVNISQHTKTVTCLQVTSDGRHLISGSLDRQVKFFNTTNYQMIHKLDYTNSVLSVGVSKDNRTLVVGQVDGTLAVHRREKKHDDKKVEEKRSKRRKQRNFRDADELVEVLNKDRLEKYDRLLRKFEYSQALDWVLAKHFINKKPEVTVAVMQELLRRQGLSIAFRGRTQDSLGKIVTFFNKYISDGRFTRSIIDFANVLLDVYEKDFLQLSEQVKRLVIELCRRIKVEEELTLEFLKLGGALEMIMTASNSETEVSRTQTQNFTKLHPSENAQKVTVINV